MGDAANAAVDVGLRVGQAAALCDGVEISWALCAQGALPALWVDSRTYSSRKHPAEVWTALQLGGAVYVRWERRHMVLNRVLYSAAEVRLAHGQEPPPQDAVWLPSAPPRSRS